MSPPLMSCPFCGADGNELKLIEIDAANWAVSCDCCQAVGPSDMDPASAAQMWNGAAIKALGRVALPREGAVLIEQVTRAGRAAQ